MTIYEVDDRGWVHRMVQLLPSGSRFAPEDVLMCRPVSVEAMVHHPAGDEMSGEEFELLWDELGGDRPFVGQVPDPELPWDGLIEHHGRRWTIQWSPSGWAAAEWTRIPGFLQLFVRGDATAARAACGALFFETPITWAAAAQAA